MPNNCLKNTVEDEYKLCNKIIQKNNINNDQNNDDLSNFGEMYADDSNEINNIINVKDVDEFLSKRSERTTTVSNFPIQYIQKNEQINNNEHLNNTANFTNRDNLFFKNNNDDNNDNNDNNIEENDDKDELNNSSWFKEMPIPKEDN